MPTAGQLPLKPKSEYPPQRWQFHHRRSIYYRSHQEAIRKREEKNIKGKLISTKMYLQT
jgi:hypothetical protein